MAKWARSIHVAVQVSPPSVSRTFSSSQAETLSPGNTSSPSPLPAPGARGPCSASVAFMTPRAAHERPLLPLSSVSTCLTGHSVPSFPRGAAWASLSFSRLNSIPPHGSASRRWPSPPSGTHEQLLPFVSDAAVNMGVQMSLMTHLQFFQGQTQSGVAGHPHRQGTGLRVLHVSANTSYFLCFLIPAVLLSVRQVRSFEDGLSSCPRNSTSKNLTLERQTRGSWCRAPVAGTVTQTKQQTGSQPRVPVGSDKVTPPDLVLPGSLGSVPQSVQDAGGQGARGWERLKCRAHGQEAFAGVCSTDGVSCR